jgi:hypothetical protein
MLKQKRYEDGTVRYWIRNPYNYTYYEIPDYPDGPTVIRSDHLDYTREILHNPNGPAVIKPDGSKEWWLKGEFKNPNDFPNGKINIEDRIEYWENGSRHRDDGPAIIRQDGYKEYWKDGRRHRLEGPAVEFPDGRVIWYADDDYHQTEEEFNHHPLTRAYRRGRQQRYLDKPDKFITNKGNIEYRKVIHFHKGNNNNDITIRKFDKTKDKLIESELHRLDGPAIEWTNGTKHWYEDGYRQRLDGPAVEHADGHKEWWIGGINITKDMFVKHPLVKAFRQGQKDFETLGRYMEDYSTFGKRIFRFFEKKYCISPFHIELNDL